MNELNVVGGRVDLCRSLEAAPLPEITMGSMAA